MISSTLQGVLDGDGPAKDHPWTRAVAETVGRKVIVVSHKKVWEHSDLTDMP